MIGAMMGCRPRDLRADQVVHTAGRRLTVARVFARPAAVHVCFHSAGCREFRNGEVVQRERR